MSAREFWCEEGKHWATVPRDETVRGARRMHAEEHAKERSVFSSPDLVELDLQLDGFYGGTL